MNGEEFYIAGPRNWFQWLIIIVLTVLVLIQWDNSRVFNFFTETIHSLTQYILHFLGASNDLQTAVLSVFAFFRNPLPPSINETIANKLMLGVKEPSYFFTSLYIFSGILFIPLALAFERVRELNRLFLFPNVLVNFVIFMPIRAVFVWFYASDNFFKSALYALLVGYWFYSFGSFLFVNNYIPIIPMIYMSALAATTPIFATCRFIVLMREL